MSLHFMPSEVLGIVDGSYYDSIGRHTPTRSHAIHTIWLSAVCAEADMLNRCPYQSAPISSNVFEYHQDIHRYTKRCVHICDWWLLWQGSETLTIVVRLLILKYSRWTCQYHCYWCHNSWRRQIVSIGSDTNPAVIKPFIILTVLDNTGSLF